MTTYVERASWAVWEREAAMLPLNYVQVIRDAGGAPLMLPPAPETTESVLDCLDALVIAGGPDVSPERYGAQPHPLTGRPRLLRDEWEIALLRGALARRLPVLAICRGAQLLNVVRGGTLHQHVPDVVRHHHHLPRLGQFGAVEVIVDTGTMLEKLVGQSVSVHCHHHQSLDRIGDGLQVVARAADGVVEAVEDPTHDFLMGVQWHPEEDATDIRLMAALRRAAENFRETAITQGESL